MIPSTSEDRLTPITLRLGAHEVLVIYIPETLPGCTSCAVKAPGGEFQPLSEDDIDSSNHDGGKCVG